MSKELETPSLKAVLLQERAYINRVTTICKRFILLPHPLPRGRTDLLPDISISATMVYRVTSVMIFIRS
ncbi:hypothetical protein BH20ACI3_BH20ACI3_14670 [soil metagenome]